MKNNQRGSVILLATLVLVAVVVIFGGYYTYTVKNNQEKEKNLDTVSSVTVATVLKNTTTSTTAQPEGNQNANINTHCGLALTVSGGSFSPDSCALKVVVAGGVGPDETTARKSYQIVLENTTSYKNIYRVSLTGLKGIGSASYTFKEDNFYGSLSENDGVNRNMTSGTLTVKQRSSEEVEINFSATFDNGATIRGSGTIPVVIEFES